MIETRNIQQMAMKWLPPVAGVLLIVMFVSLANWQLDRAEEKETTAALFDENATPVELASVAEPLRFQPVTTRGRYLPEQQFLIDNIVINGRVGYYVVTPFEQAGGGEVMLVNRGWIEKSRSGTTLPAIAVGDEVRNLTARVGRLPRVALRPDRAVRPGQNWPKVAVYPEISDLSSELGRPVSETVLLLGPEASDGYLRSWRPPEKGSMMHYGYAFQWSALALTVLVILVYQLRKKFR
ncbi:MAG: SURF1 family protein, partial [Woeseia sp.]